MKQIRICLTLFFLSISFSMIAQSRSTSSIAGIHLINYTSDEDLKLLSTELPYLKEIGINTIFLEINYHFKFSSHPELINQPKKCITKKGAKNFVSNCKKRGIQVIPEFQSLGHQSWLNETFPLLKVYPELDITPGSYPNNDSIYCREWDPTNPKTNTIVFELIHEILDAFSATSLHIGLDEVFLLDNKMAIHTNGSHPSTLFAKVINEFHQEFTLNNNIQLYMWGDRLIDASKFNYGTSEASANQTHYAIDSIPTDIIICDWHYAASFQYPSIDMFIAKGFQVLPSSFQKPDAVKKLIKYSYALNSTQVRGHLFTTWGVTKKGKLNQFKPLSIGRELISSRKFIDVQISHLKMSSSKMPTISMYTLQQGFSIHYTLDGTLPTPQSPIYIHPITLKESCKITAQAFSKNTPVGDISTEKICIHKGTGKNVSFQYPPSSKYKASNGIETIVDGIEGDSSFASGEWLGFEGTDLDVIINLGCLQEISSVQLNMLNDKASWIHPAQQVDIYTSTNGIDFTLTAQKRIPFCSSSIIKGKIEIQPQKIQYIKLKANHVKIPSGYPGEGHPAWFFIDEIILL